MVQGNRRSAAGGGSSEGCFEEGSQTADMQDSLFGLSRRCIPSWVISALRAALRRLRSETRLRASSRAHSSLPLRRIYHFIDSLTCVFPPCPERFVQGFFFWR